MAFECLDSQSGFIPTSKHLRNRHHRQVLRSSEKELLREMVSLTFIDFALLVVAADVLVAAFFDGASEDKGVRLM